MVPGTRNLRFRQGDTFTETLVFTDADDAPLDLSSHTIEAQVRRRPSTATAVDMDVDMADAATGTIVLSIAAAATAIMGSGGHVWDLQWTAPGGDVQTVLAGTVYVEAEVTR